MHFCIDNENIQKRLDVFLTENIPDVTRSYIKKIIEEEKVKVNGKIVKAGYTLKLKDNIDIEEVEVKETDIKPKEMDIDIIYEDEDVIIINKQKGVVVHPGNGNYEDTLVNGLLYSHKGKLSSINDVIRPGIVHRIDKDTTGIIVVAKNDIAHRKLSDQFKVHSITREYVAIVKGIIKEEEFTVDQPIGRSTKDRKKMAVTDKNSKRAVTHFKVLERFEKSKMTYVMATLETGRTHQIRVRMKYVGHTLLGDEIYGNKTPGYKVEGQLLHARKLGFIHHTKNEYVEFETELPEEFQQILDKLRNKEN